MSKVIKNFQAPQTPQRQARVIAVRNVLEAAVSETEENPAVTHQLLRERESILQEAQAKAERMLNSAKEESQRMEEKASNLKLEWEKEKESLQQEAYQQAFEQGMAEGQKMGREEYKQHITQAQEVISKAQEDYFLHIEKAENVILELGMRTAERILGRVIAESPSAFLDIVKRGIKEVRDLPEVQIHIHPSRYDLLSENLEELESMFPILQKLLIYPDDALSAEECFIETGEGRVIVSIDSQLREIKDKLVEILEGENE
ncbi:flagellar assembly protein FliH [Bacillus sp. AK031]